MQKKKWARLLAYVTGPRPPHQQAGSKAVTFTMGGPHFAAIEQNPHKPGSCGQLARSGHQVVQFKDVETNRLVAVAVDGEAKEYGGGKRRDQPAADKTTTQGL